MDKFVNVEKQDNLIDNHINPRILESSNYQILPQYIA